MTIIFDLDGTLLDTLTDLHASVNRVLSARGLPERSQDEVRSYLGHGARCLVSRSAPGVEGDAFEELFAAYKKDYAAHAADNALPYPGILSLLGALHSKGCKLAVLSNKPEEMTKALCASLLPPVFSAVCGQRDGIPNKPSPEMLLAILKKFGAKKEACIYIGDSDVDVQTAKNAGVLCLSALWGYRSRFELQAAGALHFLNAPADVLAYTERMSL